MPDNNEIDHAVQNAVNSLMKAVNAGKAVSDAQLRNLLNAVGKAEGAFKGAEFSANDLGRAFKGTTASMIGFAGQLGQGNTNFTVVNTAIRGVSDGLGNLAKMIPIVGDGLAGLIGQAGKAAEFSVGQIEKGYDAFGQLSDVGLIGSNGIKGLAEDFKEAGIPLKTYTSLISNSSKQLAALSGTAHDVSGTFAETMGQLRAETIKGSSGIDKQLRLLGYSTEDIGETFLNYADLQRRLGREQSFNSKELQLSTVAYAKELDLVAKLTGLSRKEQQKIVEAAMAESRWRATVMGLGEKQKLQMDTLNNGLSAFSGDLAQGMRDQATGFTQSSAAQKLFRSTNGESAKITQQLTAGQITGHQALVMFQAAIKSNMGPMTALAKATGNQAGVYTDYSKNVDFVNASIKELGVATKTQADQTKKPDTLTAGAVTAVVALENANTAIASMFMNSENAAIALEKFAGMTNMAAEAAYNMFLSGAAAHPSTVRSASGTELSGNKLEQRLVQINANLDNLTMSQILPYSVKTPIPQFEKDGAKVTELLAEMAKVTKELNETNIIIKAEEKTRISKLTNLNSIFKEYGLDFGSGGLTNNSYVVNSEGNNKRSRVIGSGSEYSSVKGVNDAQAGEIRRLLDATGRKGFELTKRVGANDQLWEEIKKLITRPSVDYNSTTPGVQDTIPEQVIKDQTDAFNAMNTKLDTIASNTNSLVRSYNAGNQIAGMMQG